MHYSKVMSYDDVSLTFGSGRSVWEKLCIAFLAVPKRSVVLMLGLLTLSTLLLCEKNQSITVDDLRSDRRKGSVTLSSLYFSNQYLNEVKASPMYLPYSNIFSNKSVLFDYFEDNFVSMGFPQGVAKDLITHFPETSLTDVALLFLLLDERYNATVHKSDVQSITKGDHSLRSQRMPLHFRNNVQDPEELEFSWKQRAMAASEILDTLAKDIQDRDTFRLILFYYYSVIDRLRANVYTSSNTSKLLYRNDAHIEHIPDIDISFVKNLNSCVFFPDRVSLLIKTAHNMTMMDLLGATPLSSLMYGYPDRDPKVLTQYAENLEEALEIIISSKEFKDRILHPKGHSFEDEFVIFNLKRALDIAEDLFHYYYYYTHNTQGIKALHKKLVEGLPLEVLWPKRLPNGSPIATVSRKFISSANTLMLISNSQKLDFDWRERILSMKNESEDRAVRAMLVKKAWIKKLSWAVGSLLSGTIALLGSFIYFRRKHKQKEQRLFLQFQELKRKEQDLLQELKAQTMLHEDEVQKLSTAERKERERIIAEYEKHLALTKEAEELLKAEIAESRSSNGDVDPVIYPDLDKPEEALSAIADMLNGAQNIYMTDAHVWTLKHGELLMSFMNILFSRGVSHVTLVLSSPSGNEAYKEIAFRENCRKLSSISGVAVKVIEKHAKKLHPRVIETEKGLLLMDRSISEMWNVRNNQIVEAVALVVPVHKIKPKKTEAIDMPAHTYVRGLLKIAVDPV